MKDPRSRRLAVALGMSVAAAIVGACGGADPSVASTAQVSEEERDLAELAEREGPSNDFPALEAVTQLAYEIEVEHPELFVGWGATAEDEPGDYWIQLTRQPDPALSARIAGLPADVSVRVGSPLSSQELSIIKAALVSSLGLHDDYIRASMTETDVRTNKITVRYWLTDDGEAAPDTALDDLKFEALQAARDVSPGGRLLVDIEFKPAEGSPLVAQ